MGNGCGGDSDLVPVDKQNLNVGFLKRIFGPFSDE